MAYSPERELDEIALAQAAAVLAGRGSDQGREDPYEVALVGEAGLEGHLGGGQVRG